MAAATAPSTSLKYAPFTSAVDVGFWHQFNKLKLEKYKLTNEAVSITGSYVNTDESGLSPRLSVLYSAFNSSGIPCGRGVFSCPGVLLHTNTIEEFRSSDRKQLLTDVASERLWLHMVSGRAVEEPHLLASFVLHMFADLKRYRYWYWFAFPAFISHTETLLEPVRTIGEAWSEQQVSALVNSYHDRPADVDGGFFVMERRILSDEDSFVCHPLTQYRALREAGAHVLLCTADPSSIAGVPGWPLRNLLTLAYLQWPSHRTHTVLCLRQRARRGDSSAGSSLLLKVQLDDKAALIDQLDSARNQSRAEIEQHAVPPPTVGWEKDKKGRLVPLTLDLSKTMDPEKVSDASCSLTLQLMRWRVVPELDVDKMAATRCLLLGAGTLGCNVARGLLGWGVTHVTFVDSGRVSYSNPVRQSLYGFSDCMDGGRYKATAAAEALKAIRPSVVTRGVVLNIPMPGHPPGPSQQQAVLEDVRQLQQLVCDHDVLFLLTDSRESRWLPSILGASQNKIVITAALGFDSFVVIRHGSKSDRVSTTQGHYMAGQASSPDRSTCGDGVFDCSTKIVPGQHLGCYFCNDIVVPVNSQRDRTLDQQCTVSRPGISMMAAAEAVELLAALLQHKLRADAPSGHGSSEGVLGSVCHSVRYNLGSRSLITPTTPAFRQCSACGQQILSAYEREGSSMLLEVFNSQEALERLSGIAELQKGINMELFDEDFPEVMTDESDNS